MSTPSKLSEELTAHDALCNIAIKCVPELTRSNPLYIELYQIVEKELATLSAQSARIKELEAALEPFDDMYDRYQRGTHWSAPYLYDNMPEVLRRAAAALKGEG